MSWLGREFRGMWRSMRYDVTRPKPLSKRRTEVLHPEYDAYLPRRSRRAYVAAGGVTAAAFVVVGGGYLAVATGLGGVLSSHAAQVPPVAAPSPVRSQPVVAVASGEQPTVPRTAPPSRRPVAVPGTVAPVAAPSCLCPVPPVPTPQASSPSPSHSPSPSPSPSVSPAPSPDTTRTGSGQP